jgi:hypothetical protein
MKVARRRFPYPPEGGFSVGPAGESCEFYCYSTARESRNRRRIEAHPPSGSTVSKLPIALPPLVANS